MFEAALSIIGPDFFAFNALVVAALVVAAGAAKYCAEHRPEQVMLGATRQGGKCGLRGVSQTADSARSFGAHMSDLLSVHRWSSRIGNTHNSIPY